MEGEDGDAEIDVFSPLTTNPRFNLLPHSKHSLMSLGGAKLGVTDYEGGCDIDHDDDDNDDNVDPREEPNLVSLMMREGVRRRGVSRAGSAPPPSPPSRFEP